MNTPIDIEKIKLYASNHTKPATLDESAQACAMEWVSVLAGEPWSDSPECACPVIAAFVRRFNDGIKDDDRRTELLRPILPLLLNTRSTRAVQERRAYLAADWAVRVVSPAWLSFAGLDVLAAELAGVAPIVDCATAVTARDVARKVRCGDAAAYAAAAARAARRAEIADAVRAVVPWPVVESTMQHLAAKAGAA